MTYYHIKQHPHYINKDVWKLFRDQYLVASDLSNQDAELLKDLLQKSVPVVITNSSFFSCPICGSSVTCWDNYCSGCGQKLEWKLESDKI